MTADLISRKAAMDAMKNAEMAFGYGKAVAVLADLPAADTSPLGAVAMRDAMVKALDERGQREQVDFGLGRETQNFYRAREIVKALPLPTHADLLAHAMRLPEVAAMREALDDMCVIAKQDDWDKSLSGRQLAYRNSCTTLAALDASHE